MLLQAGGDPLLKPVWEALKEFPDETIQKYSVMRTYW